MADGNFTVGGAVVGKVYYSDIALFINGLPLSDSYNIGGVTCAAVEDLGVDSGSDEAVSGYGMRYVYCDADRALRLYVGR